MSHIPGRGYLRTPAHIMQLFYFILFNSEEGKNGAPAG